MPKPETSTSLAGQSSQDNKDASKPARGEIRKLHLICCWGGFSMGKLVLFTLELMSFFKFKKNMA